LVDAAYRSAAGGRPVDVRTRVPDRQGSTGTEGSEPPLPATQG